MRVIEANKASSQRELAAALGVSLGKSNFLFRAVLSRGWVKVRMFKSSDNKRRYLYLLTPSGVAEKARRTQAFLQLKEAEYYALKEQIESLRREVSQQTSETADQQPVGPGQ